MKFKLFFLTYIFISFSSFGQNYGTFASAIKINNTIYNTTSSAAVHQINSSPGAMNFDGSNIGSFGQNSTTNLITAGEIKTFKTTFGNVCSGSINWRVYPVGSPTGSFNTINLGNVTDCNTSNSVFNDNLGPCVNGDQKWKDYSLNTNFIHLLNAGNYTLEIYFSITGSPVNNNTCEEVLLINNGGANFKANFSVYSPSSTPTALPNPICIGNTLNLAANPTGGVAPFTFAWTGPNGFTSVLQNPTIPNITLAEAGVYSVITTDSLGAISPSESTASVVVIPKINPTFETLLLSYCRKVTPVVPPILPLLPAVLPVQLPNTSTEGIDGAWSLSPVNDNPGALPLFVDKDPLPVGPFQVTKRYYFYPNASECGNNTFVDIIITRNATPTFGFPLVYCVDDVVPNLPLNSTNSVGGTWSDVLGNPIIKINTSIIGIQQINFTPNPGLCALQVAVFVNVKPKLTPTFNLPNFVCVNGTVPVLPTSSTNVPPIVGTWNFPTVSNTIPRTYIFTPTVALGVCSLPYSISISVNPNIVPTFNQIAPICQGTTAPTLPSSSTNSPAITGTWNPATISTTTIGFITYTFTPAAGQCAVPTTMTIEITAPNIVPTFNQIATICQGTNAPALPNQSTNAPAITGTWSPATISTTTIGFTTYTFTPAAGQCAVPTTMTIEITAPNIVPTFNQIAPICQGTTAPTLPSSSTNSPAITGTWNPATISTTTIGFITYTFTPAAGQCAVPTTMTIEITAPNIVPTFNQIATICQGTNAPALPNQSTNAPAITGTWSPATISTTTIGFTTYTFTPAAGQCAVPTTMTIEITAPNIVPTFNQIAPICQGTTAPTLPSSSTNSPAITGTWSPATISTTTIGNTIYTFTPAAGQCAVSTTMTIEITAPNIVPTFNQIAPICQGTTAPTLPSSSTNSPAITGTWSPATISTTTIGNTTYTFTPTVGQCAVSTTMTIEIKNPVVPTFNQIAPICQGTNAPNLPNPSTNSPTITGTWSPTTISTTTIGNTIYTFTPAAGQCAVPTTMTIEIKDPVVPTFNQIAPICQGTTAPTLPSSSTNSPAITGTWNPETISTTTIGFTTYTFTPAAGQCAVSNTMTIEITAPNIVPTFNQIAPICQGTTAPTLPSSSTNSPAITGTWNPETISTTTIGFTTYTFTPAAGQCAVPTTMTIEITAPNIVPTFNQIAPICQGTTAPTLPGSSTNSPAITGTWNPETISTTTIGFTTYTFTPAAGQCAVSNTMTIEITAPNIVPTFNQIAPICQGTTAPTLPSSSTNSPAITGTWNPETISTTTIGFTTYTFTPAAGQCAVPTTMTIEITAPNIVPTFNQIAPICQGTTAPTLPSSSTNSPAITGTWNPETISTTTIGFTTYTFTPAAGQCAVPTTMTIEITAPNIVPTFNQIAPICQGTTAPTLPSSSTNSPAITGTWNPETISTTTIGFTTYTFTPAAGQCAVPTTMTIEITAPNIVPTFNQIAPICQGTTAPTLPSSSTNSPAITGTWNPETISTTTIGFTTYTFTPAAGQCAVPTTMTIEITAPNIVPTFNQIAPICQGTNAPSLPNQSTNAPAITGTWSPATISTTTIGFTTYTFTPTVGQCAVSTTMTIEITAPNIVPTFNQIAPICQGNNAPTLSNLSINSISGTWLPDTINTAIIGNTTYTFTPNANQCSSVFNMVIEITSPINIPLFTQIAPICQGNNAPTLSNFSNNSISGIWSPATINTSIDGTTLYTFTPTPGQCASVQTMSVQVIFREIPTFNTIVTSICKKELNVPVLQTTSTNGITGTWSPAIVSSSLVGEVTYTFTPDATFCATKPTIKITTFEPTIEPKFDNVSRSICFGGSIPTLQNTSENGISGIWSPSLVNATNTGTYTFTSNAGQCAKNLTITITYVPQILSEITSECLNANYTLTVNSIGNSFNQGNTFTWKDETGTIISSGNATSLNVQSYIDTTTRNENFPLNYSVLIKTPEGCESSQSFKIDNIYCGIQKGISPNNDTKNDFFDLTNFDVKEFSIFNRYGTKVYLKAGYKNEWFGQTDSGEILPDGTYFYNIEFANNEMKTGWVYINKETN